MLSSNVLWAIENFNEKLDHLKLTEFCSPVKGSVIVFVPALWLAALLQGEILHYVQAGVLHGWPDVTELPCL